MKALRLVLLLGVAGMLAVVVSDYVETREQNGEEQAVEPEEIPSNLNAQANRYTWTQSTGNRRSVEGSAESFRQAKGTLGLELTGVELKIFQQDQQTFDRIVTREALFDPQTGTLYSEAEVVITLGLSSEEEEVSAEKPTVIRSTGVTFESKTATCSTDRYTEYEFEGGRGHSTGAFYHSFDRYFRMKSDAFLERFSADPTEPPLQIRAGELTYHELEQRIDLLEGASLERGSQQLAAKEAHVFLEEGVVRKIDALQGQGVDRQSGKVLRVKAERLEAAYGPSRILERLSGIGEAKMVSSASASTTRVEAHRIDLHYAPAPTGVEALLQEAHARDEATIKVRSRSGDDSRQVTASWIHLTMRPDGKEIDLVETMSPGQIELLPGDPSGMRRIVEAERIYAHYGPRNRIETLRAFGRVKVESRAANPAKGPQSKPRLRTWSDALEAHLHPETGALTSLKQWENFRFEQGQQHGEAKEALFDPHGERIELKNEASVWTSANRVSAARIVLDQADDRLVAEHSVSSAYTEAESSDGETQAGGKGLFSAAEPVFATADRLVSNQRTGQVLYTGRARLWQEQNRIEAEEILIDRMARTLRAKGQVVTWLTGSEVSKSSAGKRPTRVQVRAKRMEYKEEDRRAVYEEQVELRRKELIVTSGRLEAIFRPAGPSGAARLQKAIAREDVRVLETNGSREGFGREAEYNPATQLVHLRGAPARLLKQSGSETRGRQLTYHVNDDRLLVLGGEERRSYSLRRAEQP